MKLFPYIGVLGSIAAVCALPLDQSLSTPTASQVDSHIALNADAGSDSSSTARLVYWPAVAVAQSPLADVTAPAASPSAALTNSERIQRGLPLNAPSNLWTEKRALQPRFSDAPARTSTDTFVYQSCVNGATCGAGCTQNTLDNPARYGITAYRTDAQRQNAVDDCATFCTTSAGSLFVGNIDTAITCYCNATPGGDITCTDASYNFAYYTRRT